MRAEAISFVRARSADGATQTAIADELGVSTTSVRRWLDRSTNDAPSGNQLLAVSIAPPVRKATTITSFEVSTPRGLRITGLDLDSLCMLIERVG